jgi:predicted TPR repeat methyltransferase
LRQTRRYAHSPAYLKQLANRHGYEQFSLERAAVRTENHKDVEGLVAVIRHP